MQRPFYKNRNLLIIVLSLISVALVWVLIFHQHGEIKKLSTPIIPGNGQDSFCIQDLEFFPETNSYQVLNSSPECLIGIQFPDFPGLNIVLKGGPEYLEDPYLTAWPFEALITDSESYLFALLFATPLLYRNSITEGDVFIFNKPVEGKPMPETGETLSTVLESGIIRDDLIDNRAFQSERCFLRHHYKISNQGGVESVSVILLNGFLQQITLLVETLPSARRLLREEYWQCTFAAFAFVNPRGERREQTNYTIPPEIVEQYYIKPLGHIYNQYMELPR